MVNCHGCGGCTPQGRTKKMKKVQRSVDRADRLSMEFFDSCRMLRPRDLDAAINILRLQPTELERRQRPVY